LAPAIVCSSPGATFAAVAAVVVAASFESSTAAREQRNE
jgi:hypothetical protein